MKFGIGIPNCRDGVFYPPGIATPAQIVELVLLAEELGFDSVWGADFMAPVAEMGIEPGDAPHWYELLTTLAYLAGVTKRIELGAGVVVLPYRDPVVLAKQAITLDRFSGGRFVLGTGLGAFRSEFEAIQAPRAAGNRSKMLDEHLAALALLLNEDGPVSFEGEYYRFSDVALSPRPLRRPFPIQLAGYAPSAYRRAARYTTGLSTVFRVVEGRFKGIVDTLLPHLEREGRTLAEMELQYTDFMYLADTREAAFTAAKRSRVARKRAGADPDAFLVKAQVGTPAQAIERIEALQADGVTHYVVSTFFVDTFEQIATQVRRFGKEVLPAFR